MNISKQTKSFIQSLVNNYAHYSPWDKCHILDMNMIPDFDLFELSSRIMLDDKYFAMECMSIENPSFQEKMIPAFLNHLKNITDKDEELIYLEEWKVGILNYQSPLIQDLINEALVDYNYDKEKPSWAA